MSKNFPGYQGPQFVEPENLFKQNYQENKIQKTNPVYDLAPYAASERFRMDYNRSPHLLRPNGPYGNNVGVTKLFDLWGRNHPDIISKGRSDDPSPIFNEYPNKRGDITQSNLNHPDRVGPMNVIEDWYSMQKKLDNDLSRERIDRPSTLSRISPWKGDSRGDQYSEFSRRSGEYKPILQKQGYGMNVFTERAPCNYNNPGPGCNPLLKGLLPPGSSVVHTVEDIPYKPDVVNQNVYAAAKKMQQPYSEYLRDNPSFNPYDYNKAYKDFMGNKFNNISGGDEQQRFEPSLTAYNPSLLQSPMRDPLSIISPLGRRIVVPKKNITLTPEQEQRIQQNRAAALERRASLSQQNPLLQQIRSPFGQSSDSSSVVQEYISPSTPFTLSQPNFLQQLPFSPKEVVAEYNPYSLNNNDLRSIAKGYSIVNENYPEGINKSNYNSYPIAPQIEDYLSKNPNLVHKSLQLESPYKSPQLRELPKHLRQINYGSPSPKVMELGSSRYRIPPREERQKWLEESPFKKRSASSSRSPSPTREIPFLRSPSPSSSSSSDDPYNMSISDDTSPNEYYDEFGVTRTRNRRRSSSSSNSD